MLALPLSLCKTSCPVPKLLPCLVQIEEHLRILQLLVCHPIVVTAHSTVLTLHMGTYQNLNRFAIVVDHNLGVKHNAEGLLLVDDLEEVVVDKFVCHRCFVFRYIKESPIMHYIFNIINFNIDLLIIKWNKLYLFISNESHQTNMSVINLLHEDSEGWMFTAIRGDQGITRMIHGVRISNIVIGSNVLACSITVV